MPQGASPAWGWPQGGLGVSGSVPGPAGASLLPPRPRCLSTRRGGEGFGGSVMWGAGGSWDRGWVKFGDFGVTCAILRSWGCHNPRISMLPAGHPSSHICWCPPPLIGCVLGPGAHPNPSPPFGLLAPLQSIAPLLGGAAAPPVPLRAPPSPPCPPSHGVLPLSVPPGPSWSHFLALREGAQLLSNSLASPPASSAI